VQQLYLLLLNRPAGHFDRTRSDGVGGYLKSITRLAARDVRAEYARPGARTRERASDRGAEMSVKDAITLRPASRPDEPADGELADDVALSRLVSKTIITGVPSAAPSWLPRVLGLVVEGLSITEAAPAVEQSRFAVRRALRRWAKPAATSAT
jgi:hypothetical protein